MIIGRTREIAILEQIIDSPQAEFVAVYGRRRVGKTYLIQQCVANKGVYLECTGIKDGNLTDQLSNFSTRFSAVFYPGLALKTPTSWMEAFTVFTDEIKKIPITKKIILFLDELPWLATQKSKFIQSLDYFWNTQWNKMPNFKLIVCGSAAAWILNNLINAKGGLYNRITKTILLKPFTLEETKQFLINKKMKLDEKQVLDLYIVMGGIPFYLNQINRSESVQQNINAICFQEDGLLYSEFPRLFKSLFEKSEIHTKIVKTIAARRYGISFSDLVTSLGKKAGGTFGQRLEELEACGFIQKFLPYGKSKRNHYYKVIDEYTLFYLKWIAEIVEAKSIPPQSNYWHMISKSPAWLSWVGYTFENICYKHAHYIIKACGIENLVTYVGTWQHRSLPHSIDEGAQIDLILVRQDNAVTLCEIKYSCEPFTIDKAYAKNLMKKMEVFETQAGGSKQLFLAFITTAGLMHNVWSEELVNAIVELKDLFCIKS